jgi:uncharacterized repeat protein (TIGR01451 family)
VKLPKLSFRNVLLFCIALALALWFGGGWSLPAVQAQIVNNTASSSFTDAAGQNQTRTSNSTSFRVAGSPQLSIIKSADKQAAEPGDVVVYRLLVENTGTVAATNVTIVDQLPLGLSYVNNSLRTSPIDPISTAAAGRSLQITFASLEPKQPVTIAYAAILSPDAVRGSGRNVAQASADGLPATTATFQLAIRQGILSDCGTIIGRVFVDKNFDGEQQPGEPGVPNAVVFLDDGNRIVTDPEGLFSMQNVISGNRVGTLDLDSLPGYTLAPNLYRISDNSQSRLVRLSPGGLARMNFAVTPTFGEGES